MKKFITYSPTRINKFILVFIELKEEEKESVISSYSSSSITAVAYHAEKCVEEWYRKQYGDVEPQNDWKESYYDFLVTPKDGKQITVTIKYKREFYPKQVRSPLKD
ncbi:hypothetical protein [Priestia sp. YIM B13490]|uniref:hypothetical protein n=1 Tax=Priestia sp. YIM B13490 TaxID=3366310 RepID=UPI0036727044